MVKDEPHYSKDEFAKRGDELYEKKFARKLGMEMTGKLSPKTSIRESLK